MTAVRQIMKGCGGNNEERTRNDQVQFGRKTDQLCKHIFRCLWGQLGLLCPALKEIVGYVQLPL